MAYAQSILDEEQKRNQAAQSGNAPAPASVGGAALLGGGGSAPASGGAQTPSSSGSWTNLKSYINANQPQTMDLAGKVSQNVVGTGEAAKQAMSNLQGGYESQLKSSAVPSNYEEMIKSANENPQAFAANPQQVESFSKLRQGLYNAPSSFVEQPGYGEAATKATAAGALSSQAQTPSGQQEMIKALNPNMTAGNLRFNQLLLGGNLGARESVVNAAKPYGDLRKNLEDVAAQEEQKRQENIAAIEPAKKAVQEKFVTPQTESLKKFEEQVNQRIKDSAQDFNKNNVIRNLQNYLTGDTSNLTLDELKNFGIDTPIPFGETWLQAPGEAPVKEYKQTIDPNKDTSLTPLRMVNNPLTGLKKQGSAVTGSEWLSKYFPGTKYSEGEANRASVSTRDEIARTLALQQLLGEGIAPFYNYNDQFQAGTYNPAAYGKTSVQFT